MKRSDGGRLRLGPIVGHTDHRSTRIWICVGDDPGRYVLRVQGGGLFPFVATEPGEPEFGTAIAVAEGLRSDWRYRYQVLKHGRVVGGSAGTFRTMPDPGSMATVTFAVLSCNDQEDEGAWSHLLDFVETARPHFLLMIGDQVYMDQWAHPTNVWARHLDSPPAVRRQAMAEKYHGSWSRESVRRVLASTPCYMMWDDHDIRDGWGSFAPDSPTLADRHPHGRRIFEKHRAYFEDARDVFWHFQMCRNPPRRTGLAGPSDPASPPPAEAPAAGTSEAMPFVFRCGRLAVLVLDSRGDRDLWRPERPALGTAQWEFLTQVLAELEPTIEAVAIVTPVPIVTIDPEGQVQVLLGRRTDDVEMFKNGDAEGLLELMGASREPEEDRDFLEKGVEIGKVVLTAWVQSRFGASLNLGDFRIADVDDVRDQWSSHFTRAEQIDLIHAAGAARLSNRIPAHPREVVFIGGDLHVAGMFDISVSRPPFEARSLFASGISRDAPSFSIGIVADEEFQVGEGIHARLREIVGGYNFGVVQVIPTGSTPVVVPAIAHQGHGYARGITLSVSTPGLP